MSRGRTPRFEPTSVDGVFECHYDVPRNDRRLNNYLSGFSVVWNANHDIQGLFSVRRLVAYLVKYVTKQETVDHQQQTALVNVLRALAHQQPSLQSLLFRALIEIVNSCDYSATQAAFVLLQIPLFSFSGAFSCCVTNALLRLRAMPMQVQPYACLWLVDQN